MTVHDSRYVYVWVNSMIYTSPTRVDGRASRATSRAKKRHDQSRESSFVRPYARPRSDPRHRAPCFFV